MTFVRPELAVFCQFTDSIVRSLPLSPPPSLISDVFIPRMVAPLENKFTQTDSNLHVCLKRDHQHRPWSLTFCVHSQRWPALHFRYNDRYIVNLDSFTAATAVGVIHCPTTDMSRCILTMNLTQALMTMDSWVLVTKNLA